MASLGLLVFLAVGLQQGVTAAGSCPAGAKPFPSDLVGTGKVDFANLFDITYYDTYKVLEYSETLASYQASHADSSLAGKPIPPMVLYQCDTPKPTGAGLSEARFFEIPIQGAAVGWSGPVPFFELLGVTEKIHTIDLSYISSPCTQLLEECVPGIHWTSSGPNWTDIASGAQVAFSDSWGTGFVSAEKDVPFQISLDPGALQRAEWIRFVAAFFNEEARADEVFSHVTEDYRALQAYGTQLSTNKGTEWNGRQPKAAWVYNWAGTLTMSNAVYKRDLVRDAGAQLVPMPAEAPTGCSFTTGGDGAKNLGCPDSGDGLASFKSFLAEADVIICESGTSIPDFQGTYKVNTEDIPALARDPPNLFNTNGVVSDTEGAEGISGTSFFELFPSQPHQFLAGLMEAIWGDNFESPCGMKFLRRAFPGEGQTVLGDSDCVHHDEGGDHDCEQLHKQMLESPSCSTGVKVILESDAAEGNSVVSAVAAASALWSLLLWG